MTPETSHGGRASMVSIDIAEEAAWLTCVCSSHESYDAEVRAMRRWPSRLSSSWSTSEHSRGLWQNAARNHKLLLGSWLQHALN